MTRTTMKDTRITMGMPITVHLVMGTPADADAVFTYFSGVDDRFSTYKPNSEISQLNRGLPEEQWSAEMKRVMALCEQTKVQTGGFFDIRHHGELDPSGLVKGWAIHNAAHLLLRRGVKDFCIEAGGDIQVHGRSPEGEAWNIGIRSPFNTAEVIKTVQLHDAGIATSGTYLRGQHIYSPFTDEEIHDVASITVIGPNVYEADRFATAAFAMGTPGIKLIEAAPALEGYMVGPDKMATLTTGFERYVVNV